MGEKIKIFGISMARLSGSANYLCSTKMLQTQIINDFPEATFLWLGDKVVNRRANSSKIGKMWYDSMMLLDVLQGCGRGSRAIDDYCVVYIGDEQVSRVYSARPLVWPEWFRDAETWDDMPDWFVEGVE